MKKIAAILLIIILSFNWYGYRIVTNILTKDADQQLEAQLDNNEYDESQLVEVRIPLNMPYQRSETGFERHYGEIETAGKFYTYVKRKIENGVLVLLCIPNSSKERIKAAGNDYFKTVNGLEQGQPDKKQNNNSNFAKNFWSEYDGRETDFTIDVYSRFVKKSFLNKVPSLHNLCLTFTGQPPENPFVVILG